MVLRSVTAAALLGGAASWTACLQQYEWRGGGGAGGGDAGGSAGAGGSEQCTGSPVGSATFGPYGAAKLYFGTPQVEDSLTKPVSDDEGHVSPDGMRLLRPGANFEVLEHTRQSPLAPWADPLPPQTIVYELHPHLSPDLLHAYACDGSTGKCMIHVRPDLGSPFGAHHYFQNSPPFDGAGQDSCFTPTPDGRTIAFCSNRVAPDDDGQGPVDVDLWIAAAVDALDPPEVYAALTRLDAPSAIGWSDVPSWLSEDALTLAFHSNREGNDELFVTSRATIAEPFGPAMKISELSDPVTSERHLTMPSLATLAAQPCGAGYAYFARNVSLNERDVFRVPVCVGAPCSP